MSIHQKHISRLFQMTINRLNGFLHSLEIFLGKLVVMPPFYLYPYYTINLAHKRVAENPCGIFKSTHVNTKKNCIHVLCKNNLANCALVGQETD